LDPQAAVARSSTASFARIAAVCISIEFAIG
jgi:hypothetical protein